jgi:hypothetical protein
MTNWNPHFKNTFARLERAREILMARGEERMGAKECAFMHKLFSYRSTGKRLPGTVGRTA